MNEDYILEFFLKVGKVGRRINKRFLYIFNSNYEFYIKKPESLRWISDLRNICSLDLQYTLMQYYPKCKQNISIICHENGECMNIIVPELWVDRYETLAQINYYKRLGIINTPNL